MGRQRVLTCFAGPASHFTVDQQRHPPQVAPLAGLGQIAQDVLKAKF